MKSLFLILVFINVALSEDVSRYNNVCIENYPAHGDGVFCADDNSAVVFCRDKQAQSSQPCPKGCRRHDRVPDSCATLSKTFVWTHPEGQRQYKWRLYPPTLVKDWSDDELRKTFAQIHNKSTGIGVESTGIGSGGKTDDLVWDELDPVPSFPAGANLYGIKVNILGRSHQHMVAEDSDKEVDGTEIAGNTYCYIRDLELRTGQVNSGNRGSQSNTNIGARRALPRGNFTDIQPMVYGGRLDLWDVYDDKKNLGHDTWLELDANVGTFDTNLEATHGDTPTNDVMCRIQHAWMDVLYDVPNTKATATQHYLVRGGDSSAGTSWHYYHNLDEHHAPLPQEPDKDANGNRWFEADYDMTESEWNSGKGLFGFGSDDDTEATPLSSKTFTAYFRTKFTLDFEPSCVEDIYLKYTIDDGAIVYLNGQELWWMNMDPEHNMTGVTFDTRALREVFSEDEQKQATVPDRVLLLKGENTFAVEVHQVHPKSSDLSFDLSAYVYNNCAGEAPGPAEPSGEQTPAAAHTPSPSASPQHSEAPANEPEAPQAPGTAANEPTQKDDTTPSSAPVKSSSDTLTTLLLIGAVIGIVGGLLYFLWKRKQQRSVTYVGDTRPGFAHYVPEDDNSSTPLAQERGGVPDIAYNTEPELARAPYNNGATLGGVARTTRKVDEWDDF